MFGDRMGTIVGCYWAQRAEANILSLFVVEQSKTAGMRSRRRGRCPEVSVKGVNPREISVTT